MVQQPWAGPTGSPPPSRPGQPPPHPPHYGPRPPVYAGYPPGPPPPYPPVGYPPPYIYEPPPPPARFHRAPYTALWFGARFGVLFPFGHAYNYAYTPNEFGEPWGGLASTGVALEGDLGIRMARHTILYGFWEHGELSTGNDESWRTGAAQYGDQEWARTDYVGGGLRWSSRPDTVGIVLDGGLGYRWFHERWASNTELNLGGFGEFRVGFGVDLRLTPWFSLSPMFMYSGGIFYDGDIRYHGGPSQPIFNFANASHGTVTLTLGAHFDLGS